MGDHRSAGRSGGGRVRGAKSSAGGPPTKKPGAGVAPGSKPAVKPAATRPAGRGPVKKHVAAEPVATARAIPQNRAHAFPIVGIGASAGGLEALELFLKNVPEHSGMAYVVIQHLDPTHKGVMVELLQRTCAMPVVQVRDRQMVEPDTVYVIPPNKDMSILHGMLHLLPKTSPRGLNLPIDFFFRSLAEDQQERSIGVVLSGMGSDGTLGLRAIKEKAGAAFVQALSSAKFDGMPRSAIEAGLADVIATAQELPGRIAAYHLHAPYISKPETALESKQLSALEKVFILLRAQTGSDFSLYKKSTIYRRIERRMSLHQIDNIANYVRFLRENPGETELLFKELLIGVTSFFRDAPAWEDLGAKVLPEMLRGRPSGSILRAWVAGCSTGEEAYSLAMVIREALDHLKRPRNIGFQIFATDLDRDAIETARQGLYPANIAADVSPERLRRFFLKDERGFRVRKEIREMVVFAPQNIIMDPPFTKLDILCCRNLLIYLAPELQKKLIPLFHYGLNAGGILFLGSAETVGHAPILFHPLDAKARLYRRLDSSLGAAQVEIPAAFAGAPAAAPDPNRTEPAEFKAAFPNLQTLAERVIIQRFAPAAVVTNDKGDIVYISGRTGKYLEPAVGKANLNVFAMAREGLRYDLGRAFSAALKDAGPVEVRGLKVRTEAATQKVDLTVQKLTEPRELGGMVFIVLTDVPGGTEAEPEETRQRRSDAHHVPELRRELQRAQEEIQTTREEMQTSQEELRSTNEELQSTNEELQSTNEELTTSKEEMQSMNEELQTVNQELQSKVDELSSSNNDMKNLLNSTELATLFLDGELHVRRFTTETSKLIKLIPSDAGRAITDIATDLDYPDLAGDARAVLRTLVFKEKLVTTRDGRWFSVRIMPYRTLDNVIDGLVITFTDATLMKQLETALGEQAGQLRQMTESLPSLVWGARPDGAWDYLSRQWVEYTGVAEADQIGYGWLDQVSRDDRERARAEWNSAIRSGKPFNAEYRIRARDGSFRWFRMRAVPIQADGGRIVKWYGTSTDVDDLKQAAVKLASVLEGTSEGFVDLDHELVVTQVNAAAERLLRRKRDALVGRKLFEAVPEGVDSVLGEKLRTALRDRCPQSFQAEHPSLQGWHMIRLLPHAKGLSIFLQPAGESERASVREPGRGDGR